MEIITQIKQKVANNRKIMQQIKELKCLSLERALNIEERATCKFNQAAKPISSKLNFLTF